MHSYKPRSEIGKMRPTSLTLTLILPILLATFCQGECPIECYCETGSSSGGGVTTCTGDKLLTRFPSSSKIYAASVASSTTRLEYTDYSISYLSREDFLQIIISNLTQELSLRRNSLESLDNATFSTFSSQHGKEPSTSTSQEDHHHHHLSSPSSESLFKLRSLDLSQNKLRYFVGGDRLGRLKVLDLSSNELQQVYNLGRMGALESINLRENRIKVLYPGIFQGLKYLQYVNLDSNNLGSVDPSTFSNLPALAHLILSSNPVTNLVPGFYWNSRVQFVDVSHIGLTSVPTSLTKTVRDLRCSNNNLTIIRQTDFESYPNVGLLVLDENLIESVEDDAFGRLDFLTRLWMNGNRLTRIPFALPPSLSSLHLESNLITNLSATDFSNLHSLSELNLHGNRITSLPPFVFGELWSLKNLDLRSNQIDVIYRHSFTNLSQLETLDMSQNPLKVIVTQAFTNLGKLSLLHLSRLEEPIEFDTTSFSSLGKLQILEIDDSPHFAQKLIGDSALIHLPGLRELNLERCELVDLTRVFSALVELDSLQIVKLGGNQWDCGMHSEVEEADDLYEPIHQLMNRRTIVDQPECEQPPNLKGVLLSSLNFSRGQKTRHRNPTLEDMEEMGEDEQEGLLDFTELTPDQQQDNEADQISYPSSSSSEGISDHSSGGGRSNTSASFHIHQSNSNSSTSLDKVTNAPNTNSPENAPHALDANVNPFRSTPSSAAAAPTNTTRLPALALSPVGESGQSNTKRNLPTPSFQTTSALRNETVGHQSAATTIMNGTNRLNDSSRSGNRDGDGITKKIDLKTINLAKNSDSDTASNNLKEEEDLEDAVPTRSYFEDSNWKRSPSPSVEMRTNSISSSNIGGSGVGSSSRNKKPPALASGSSDKTKTNDDNTIIDEGGRRRSGGGGGSRSRSGDGVDTGESYGLNHDDGEETGPKSIDGFPSGYSDVDGLSFLEPTSSSSSRDDRPGNPKAFHLRKAISPSGTSTSLQQEGSSSSPSSTIIIKTIVISATVCLVSILLLLSLSMIVYKVSRDRRRGGISSPLSSSFVCCSATRTKSDTSSDPTTTFSCSQLSTSYTRFGRKSSSSSDRRGRGGSCGNQNVTDFDSDSSDQVELSGIGITNRLYSENEEIYHIT